jgi:carboxymethylenebutenolidase
LTDATVVGAEGVDTAAIEGVWERHTKAEFVDTDVEATMETMTGDPSVLHVATSIGARGRESVRAFYRDYFIGHQASNMTLLPLSRTVTLECLVDEMTISFTHDAVIPWILPGLEPTGRRVTVPIVTVIGMRDGLVHSEHIYWDQATVLAQIGLIDARGLPVVVEGQAEALGADAPESTRNALLR